MTQFTLGFSLVLGSSLLFAVPALAQTYTVNGPVTVFTSNGTTTSLDLTNNIDAALQGNSAAPGGNVELYNTTDGLSLSNFKNITPASLLTDFGGGKTVLFESLTFSDWFAGAIPAYGQADLANQWFADTLTTYGLDNFLTPTDKAGLFTQFAAANGFQRLSDANIAYVSETSTGIKFGLAGSLTLSDFGFSSPLPGFNPALLPAPSEVVKVTFDGKTDYYYSFAPTASGQVNDLSATSHRGNFEIAIAGGTASTVPEPSLMLGLASAGGLLLANRRRSQADTAA